MKEETRKAVFLGLAIAVFLAVTVVATGVLVTKKGTGTMDVEVSFVVTDATSGDPISMPSSSCVKETASTMQYQPRNLC